MSNQDILNLAPTFYSLGLASYAYPKKKKKKKLVKTGVDLIVGTSLVQEL